MNKRPAYNEQFATIGSVARMTLCAKQHHLALVQAFVMPSTAASCHHVVRQRRERCGNNRDTVVLKKI